MQSEDLRLPLRNRVDGWPFSWMSMTRGEVKKVEI